MLLTQKVRIWHTPQQEHVLWDLSEKCRLLYNFALQERKEDWQIQQSKIKEIRVYMNYQQQSKMLPDIKQKYPEDQWVYSKVLQQTLKKLNENFHLHFSQLKHSELKARRPRFKGNNLFLLSVITKVALNLKITG